MTLKFRTPLKKWVSNLLIRKRVYRYSVALILARGISFLFSLLIIRSLPLADIGTYYYLIGIAFPLEIFMTWGSMVSIQTLSGKSENSNVAISAVLLSAGLCTGAFLCFLPVQYQFSYALDSSLNNPVAVIFIFSNALCNAITGIALAYYRSLLSVKKDIYILLTRELLKFAVVLVIQAIFSLTLPSVLLLLSGVNILMLLSVLPDLFKRSDIQLLRLKDNTLFLFRHGFLLMLTFLVYAFPFIFIRIFSYTGFGEEAAGILNICLVTHAGFSLYSGSWGMAVKPVIGRLNNLQDLSAISKLWKDNGLMYILGCLILYIIYLVFYAPVLNLFKLDPHNTTIRHIYFIVLLFNLVYSLGSINNSFMQMLKLTRFELRGLAWGLLLYPMIIGYCHDKSLETLAWAMVGIELFKLMIQEVVFRLNSNLKLYNKLLINSFVIIIALIITLTLTHIA